MVIALPDRRSKRYLCLVHLGFEVARSRPGLTPVAIYSFFITYKGSNVQ
jgi:hypothetical protein